ncbi:hypothetical protein HY632_02695 [Candidatus Uhrbacteria bacterium]|nr:hypothetical protein [Candidatus Uhrbacteria bacterium]
MSLALTPAEQSLWELRLGWRVDHPVVWGDRVAEYLYDEVAEDRRVPHVAHALRVFPYVPRTEGGLFAERRIGPLTLAEHEPACRQLLDALFAAARDQDWGADEFAAQCMVRLSPLEDVARACIFGDLFHLRRFCPFVRGAKLGITLPEGNHWDVLVRYRDTLAPIVRRLRHFACCLTAEELAGAFDQCTQISSVAERRVVLLHVAQLILRNRDKMLEVAAEAFSTTGDDTDDGEGMPEVPGVQ